MYNACLKRARDINVYSKVKDQRELGIVLAVGYEIIGQF